jgi:hypothetical protein
MILYHYYTPEENRLYCAMAIAWCLVEYHDRPLARVELEIVAPRCRQLVEEERIPILDGDFAALEVYARRLVRK